MDKTPSGVQTPFWRLDNGEKGVCYVCLEYTEWIYIDFGFQHPDCDMYPDGDKHERVIRGKLVSLKNDEQG